MNEEMKKFWEFKTIHSEPVYTLAECIAASPYDTDVDDDDYENDDYEDISVDDLTSGIKERFQKAIYLCDEQQLAFLRFAAELSEKKAAWETDVAYYPFRVFCLNDFVYLFENNGDYYLVLPVELKDIFREITNDEGFSNVNGKNLELMFYATALLELYGAYEIQHFVVVWNHHHKDKITYKEAETLLSDLAYFESDYYFEEDYVVHDCLAIDEFDELFDKTYELKYYMPTKSIIRECVTKRHDYDYKIPGEKEMDDFLAEYIKDERILDDIQLEITYSCVRLESPAEVREILADGDLPIGDADFCGKFERLYNILRENTRIWELRGFTPYQYQIETGKTIPRFKLPKEKERKN